MFCKKCIKIIGKIYAKYQKTPKNKRFEILVMREKSDLLLFQDNMKES